MEGKRFKTTWDGNAMVDFHLKALGRELRQLKTAFKLAVALNRTIIMPKVGGHSVSAARGPACRPQAGLQGLQGLNNAPA